MLAARGTLVKVNSVMIPGINDGTSGSQCRGEDARRFPAQHHAADLRSGAWHTFRPDGQRGPTPAELKTVAGCSARASWTCQGVPDLRGFVGGRAVHRAPQGNSRTISALKRGGNSHPSAARNCSSRANRFGRSGS